MANILQGQELRQSQKLQLSLFQKQSLAYLQSSLPELLDEIESLQKKHPELQWKDGKVPELNLGDASHDKKRLRYPGEWQLEHRGYLSWEEQREKSQQKHELIESYSHDISETGELEESLQEVLFQQLRSLKLNAKQREFGELVIQNLDEKGFHRENVRFFMQGKKEERLALRKVLHCIQAFEPQGCATHNPLEALQVQASLLYPESPLCLVLRRVSSLEQFSDKEEFFRFLHKELQGAEKEAEVFSQLKELKPFPAIGYKSNRQAYRIYPEVEVLSNPDNGAVELRLLNQLGQKLQVTESHTPTRAGGEEEKQRKRQKEEMEQLLSQLERREETLLAISKEIFKVQQDFLQMGAKGLQKLSLQMIADNLGFHISTISRSIRGKYCKTAWGIFPLAFFLQSSGRREFSRDRVKEELRDYLQIQGDARPTDEQVRLYLQRTCGIVIARRTVNKYRNEIESEYI